MNITENSIVSNHDEVAMSSMVITYNQEDEETNGEFQTLTVELRNQCAESDQCYLNIKTGESGWSFDKAELNMILEDFMNRARMINKHCDYTDVHTDNSEVIANLQAENAWLKRTLKGE